MSAVAIVLVMLAVLGPVEVFDIDDAVGTLSRGFQGLLLIVLVVGVFVAWMPVNAQLKRVFKDW